MPHAASARSKELARFGRTLFSALARTRPEAILLDDVALRDVLVADMATSVSARRAGLGSRVALRKEAFQFFRDSEFSGLCLQGSRVEAGHSPLGLKSAGWVFERALVVGQQPGGRRVAAWVEGSFLLTNAGFRAIDLVRVEEPRWEHSDLEIAVCDMEVGLGTPLPVVDVIE